MTRPVIGGIAAALIAALSAVAYFVTVSSLESQIRRDLKDRVANAQDLLIVNAELDGLGLLEHATDLASDLRLVRALEAEGGANPVPAERAFNEFRGTLGVGARPDILALVDASGQLVALASGDQVVRNPIASTYLEGGAVKYPALALALGVNPIRIADVWAYENQGPMRVAVAPVIDTADGDSELLGAVLIAYGIDSVQATRASKLLGAEVVYFFGDRVQASSFSDKELDPSLLSTGGLAASALASESGHADVVDLEINGVEYVATAAQLPLISSGAARPPGYPPPSAGTLVAMSVDGAMASLGPIKLAILLVGLGAIVVVFLAMFLTARRILGPLDAMELGVADMLNGNLDRSFDPSGSDLDGLANGLNVLMARLLGRPEPGEEEYDDDGNLIQPSASMRFSRDSLPPEDALALALAAEPEDDYYTRLYAEYTAAIKKAGGSITGLTEESFINKLRLNEATLCEKYEASSVRFVVEIEDGKVILLPVPFQ
jgi:hypothetical protein